ncbi:hypothetical protein RHOFW510R12_04005 [Rhodanobacter sp. FW510-R12]|uniref:YagK/YfjJ domain-containing protein n=1 Tax=Rhodanobacter TaxID=75309 RepID=UPI000484172D|nr:MULTISPECIES: inovirus-type Gp2 protein [Rhodanobacter]TAN14613.1 MAG: inovirus Gp2 family protein [Rhodanobacter sp.]UJJ55222.1 inovirus Gp2 family protein [Rhodanobacter thiooxydans]
MNTAADDYLPVDDVDFMMKEMERQIAEEERNYHIAAKRFLHDGDGNTSISDESECLRWIAKLEHLAKRICGGQGRMIKANRRPRPTWKHVSRAYSLTSLGNAVWQVCCTGIPLIEMASPSSRYRGRHSWPAIPFAKHEDLAQTESMVTRFNPHIAVMLRACQKAMPAIRHANGMIIDLSNEKVRRRIEWIARFVRRCCRSSWFKRIEANRTKLERKNFLSCCRYMAEGFQQYSRLLVLRVDLYIRPTHHTAEDVRLAEKCLERYLRDLDEGRIVPDVLRRICKRECGFDRGMHYHLLVALDGHKHQNACHLSKLLGEKWLKKCGPLRASYFNCYVRRHHYEYNAIGSVHISDWRMLMGIKEAIKYLAKGDGYVMTGHKRNLMRGTMKQFGSRPKRGAPRRVGHDMILVDAILGNPRYEP